MQRSSLRQPTVDEGDRVSQARGGCYVGFEIVQPTKQSTALASDGVYSFPFQVPRDVWTHLAYVAEIINGETHVKLFADGELVGEHVIPGDRKICLPCQYLGSTTHSFSGLVLDIRFWSLARSVSEIRRDMHRVLPVRLSRTQYFVNHLLATGPLTLEVVLILQIGQAITQESFPMALHGNTFLVK